MSIKCQIYAKYTKIVPQSFIWHGYSSITNQVYIVIGGIGYVFTNSTRTT